jgi:hypothetical protein
MLKREYHYLVAGLPDLTFEQGIKNFDFKAFVEEVYGHTARQDHGYIRELFSCYDFLNVHNLLQNREDLFDPKGFYNTEFWTAHLEQKEENLEGLNCAPQYFTDIAERFRLGRELGNRNDEYHNMANYTWSRFYQEIENTSKNKFNRSWFRFDQLLRNIQSAWLCRKLDLSVQEQLVGCAEEIAYFVKNNLPDFGLKREIALGEQIFNLLDEDINMLEREFRFDQIRWQMADELTIFNYFDIDKILAFLAKADILDRWLRLDKERGAMLFDNFVKTMVAQKDVNL